ncbi:MAG: hypothetical protein AB8G22_24870 [Saprospiraceae bacterium]
MGLKDVDYGRRDTEYDREFNLLYIKVNPTIKTGIVKSKTEVDIKTISNLAIYEIEKDNLIHFFEKGTKNKIVHYFYETCYNEKLERMDFNTQSYQIFNNQNIEKREKSDKLFMVTEKEQTNEYELWISSRSGINKQMVKRFQKELDWRIDVYNKKVLFIHKLENEIKVTSIDW